MPKLSVQLRIKPCPSPFVTINDNFISIDNKKYEFNHIYDENSTFHKIYQNSLVNMLDSFFSKYNCCIICYGQTGSGKTYTMGLCIDRLGVYEEYLRKENGEEKMLNVHKNNYDIENTEKENNYDIENKNVNTIYTNNTYTNNTYASNTHANTTYTDTNDKDNIDYFGIVPDSIEYIFTKTSSISLTFIEIYNEEVIDLLTDYRTPINLRQSKSELSIISTCITCTSKLHTIQTLREGLKNRIVRSTKMNLNSSRSHAILTLIMNDTKFTFVDLAGSERLKKLDASRIKETISINSGLLALSNVITALAKKSGYVPYRDSKLTRVLKSNLVNCNTLIMACIASDKQNLSESLNTLKYAHRAMNIDAVVKKNVDSGNKILVELKNENLRLKYENERLKQLLKLGCNKVIVDENDRLKNENEDLKKRVRDLEIVRISYEELKGMHEKMIVDMKRANREKRSSLNLGSLRNSLEIEDTKSKRKSIDNYENRVKRNSIEIQRQRSSIEAQENHDAQNKRNKLEMQAKYNDIETTNDTKEVQIKRNSAEMHLNGIGCPKKAALENKSKSPEHSRNRYFDDLNETKKLRSINECENIENIQTNDNAQKIIKTNSDHVSNPFFNADLMDHEIVNPFIDNLSIKEKNEDSYLTDEINYERECKIPATPMKSSKNDVSLHKPVKRRGVTFDLSKTEIKYLEVKKKKFSDILMFSRRQPSINTPGIEIQNVSDSNKKYNIESILLDEPFLTALCIHDNFIFCSTLSGTLYRIQKDTKKVEKLFKGNSKIKNLLIYNDLLLYTTENKVKSCIIREVGGVSHYAIHDYIKVSTEISRIALKKDFLCIGTETGYIYVYDLRNKEICLTSDQTHNEGIKTILNTNEMLYIGSTDVFVFNNHYSRRIDIQTSKMFLFDGKIISLHTYSIAVIENGKIENVFETLNYNMTGCALANSFVIGSKNGTISEYVFKDGIKLVNEFNVDSCIVDIVYDRNMDTIYVITMKREIFVVKLDSQSHLTV